MRILFLQDDFPPQSFGGAGNVAFDLAREIKKRGHSVFVLTAVRDKKDEGSVEYEGLKVFKVYSNYHERWRAYLSLYNPQTVKKIKNLIDEIKPDIIHAHNVHYHLSYHSLKLAKRSGAKVFLTAHDGMIFSHGKFAGFIDLKNPSCASKNYRVSRRIQIRRFRKRYNPFRNLVIRHYLRYVDTVFAVSHALKDALNQNGIRGVETVHNGIDVDQYSISPDKVNEFKKRYNILDKKIVLFGGRISKFKGSEKIIEAMKIIVFELPAATLLVAGRGGDTSAPGLVSHTVFTGWLSGDDLKCAYHASDVVVMPSIYFEAFGLIVLEAMAAKKPVVATCFGGPCEIVIDGQTGYIENPFHIKAMAEKITYLLNNSEEAARFGKKGYERARDCFSLDKQAAGYLSFYNAK